MQTIQIPPAIGDQGFNVPLEGCSTVFKFLPVFGISRGGAGSHFILFDNHLKYKVVLSRTRAYSEIERVEVNLRVLSVLEAGYTQSVLIAFRPSPFALLINIREQQDLRKILNFLRKKKVPLAPTASKFASGEI